MASRLTEEAHAPALAALPDLAEADPAAAGYDQRQLDTTLEDLGYIVRFFGATRRVDDPTVLTEFLTWVQDLLVHRGVPSIALAAGPQDSVRWWRRSARRPLRSPRHRFDRAGGGSWSVRLG